MASKEYDPSLVGNKWAKHFGLPSLTFADIRTAESEKPTVFYNLHVHVYTSKLEIIDTYS